MNRVNQYGQIIGKELPNWKIRADPRAAILIGRTCRLEPLDVVKHADELYAAYYQSADARDWTFLKVDAFENFDQFYDYIETEVKSPESVDFAIIESHSGKAVGIISFVHFDPINGAIEVGRMIFSPLLKQTIASTESQYLMMFYAFDEIGYRRYEWRCDSLNTQSRKAAERLGFKLEGIFRQHIIYKNRNHDTAWFSIIDEEWPKLKAAFQAWLSPENFNMHGKQVKKLNEFQWNEFVWFAHSFLQFDKE